MKWRMKTMKKMAAWIVLAALLIANIALAADFTPSPRNSYVLKPDLTATEEQTNVKIEAVENTEAVNSVFAELEALVQQDAPLLDAMDEESKANLAQVLPEGTMIDSVQLREFIAAKITFVGETRDEEEFRIVFDAQYPEDSVLACLIGILPETDAAEDTEADAETLQPKKIALTGCEGAEWIAVPAHAEADGSVVVVLDRAAQQAINGREIVFSIIEVTAAEEVSPAA